MGTRRDSLKIIGAVSATCAFPFSADELYGQEPPPEHVHAPASPPYNVPVIPPFEPRFFTVAEGRLVSRLADLIIPPTTTPGAAAAGVPHYIDSVVALNVSHQAVLREGLAWLDAEAAKAQGKAFIELGEEQQIELLMPLSLAVDTGRTDVPGAKFFMTMKNLTADGYYTSYAGLVQELDYKGNQMLSHFEGCVHEH